MARRLVVAYVLCVALSNPLMWGILGICTGRDTGSRTGVLIHQALSQMPDRGKSLTRPEMQQLAEQIAKRVHATTNWYKIAAKTSTIQFAILGALWGLIAGEWLYVAVLPLTTFVWGNALVQQQIRDALSWEQRLIIFVVAQLIVCYMAAGLTVAAVGWLRRIRRRRAR